ncbi:DUF6249 domain-containing protein [Melittangium boletus]|uniref:DUF6249 domain-containing protein n=1 Tax=Melittangium boletus DSM 14713 TaxID=1294270 RepID=A0A250IH90_9BACT|nr:DUF6249 domain-containing protein [Melittangium boletus]ATB30531.1 hypothetical protein MEBOL_003992 [Melittangium boletus DSM 14713]
MKKQLLTVCILAALAVGGRAESAPPPEVPEPPPAPSVAQSQQLESEVRRIDPEGRLTREQLFQLLQQREERQAGSPFDPTPVLICVSLFGCMATAFLAWLYASYRRMRMIHETVRMMVEKGVELPPGLLAPPPRKPSDLRRGIILSAAGLGLTVFLAALPDTEGAWGAGLTLFLIGLGHLLVWRLQGGRGPLSSALRPEPQP